MTVQGREPHTGMDLTDRQEPHKITQTCAPVRSQTRLSSCSFSKKGTFLRKSEEPAPLVERSEALYLSDTVFLTIELSIPWKFNFKMWLNHSRLGECPGVYASPFIMLHPLLTILKLQKSRREAFTPQKRLSERRFI